MTDQSGNLQTDGSDLKTERLCPGNLLIISISTNCSKTGSQTYCAFHLDDSALIGSPPHMRSPSRPSHEIPSFPTLHCRHLNLTYNARSAWPSVCERLTCFWFPVSLTSPMSSICGPSQWINAVPYWWNFTTTEDRERLEWCLAQLWRTSLLSTVARSHTHHLQ